MEQKYNLNFQLNTTATFSRCEITNPRCEVLFDSLLVQIIKVMLGCHFPMKPFCKEPGEKQGILEHPGISSGWYTQPHMPEAQPVEEDGTLRSLPRQQTYGSLWSPAVSGDETVGMWVSHQWSGQQQRCGDGGLCRGLSAFSLFAELLLDSPRENASRPDRSAAAL